MMRTLFLIIIAMMLGIVPTLHAQQGAGSVSVKLNRADHKGNALNLNMDVKVDHIDIDRYESLSLKLVLKGSGQGQTLTLPPIVINGANKRQMYERKVALLGLATAKGSAYAVLKNDPELIQFLAYVRAVPYKAWMDNCQLILVGERQDYNNNTVQTFTNVLEKKLRVRRAAATPKGTSATTRRPASTTTRPSSTTTRPASPNRPARR